MNIIFMEYIKNTIMQAYDSQSSIGDAYQKAMIDIMPDITGEEYRFPTDIAERVKPDYSLFEYVDVNAEGTNMTKIWKTMMASKEKMASDFAKGDLDTYTLMDQYINLALQYRYYQYLYKNGLTHETYLGTLNKAPASAPAVSMETLNSTLK